MKKTQLRICLVLLANQENGKKEGKGVGRKLHKNVKKILEGSHYPMFLLLYTKMDCVLFKQNNKKDEF